LEGSSIVEGQKQDENIRAEGDDSGGLNTVVGVVSTARYSSRLRGDTPRFEGIGQLALTARKSRGADRRSRIILRG
jgi:hypothetical protein